MAEDFGRSLNDVLGGYQGMSQTLGDFGVTQPSAIPNPMSFVPPAARATFGGTTPYIPPVTPPAPYVPPVAPPFAIPAPYIQQNQGQQFGSQIPYAPPPQPAPYYAPQYSQQQQQSQPMFAQQMAQAQQNQVNATYASAFDPSMMYPGMGMMTQSNMGVFRDQMAYRPNEGVPAGGFGAPPPLPLIPMQASLFRTSPHMFNRGFDAALGTARDRSTGYGQSYASYAEGAGRMVLAGGGGIAGGVIGGGIGAYVSGGSGAMTGASIGSTVGEMAQFLPYAGEAIAAGLRPALERRYDAIQMQGASRAFMSRAGKDLDISGTGLSSSAAQGLSHDFTRYAKQSGGEYTRQDYSSLMQMSGEQGLLDFAQNREEIAKTTKKLMSVIGTFAEVTGDPDFRSNIQKVAKLRQLGVGINEMETSVKNMEQYARMAGVSLDRAMDTGGQQGAVIYQNSGLNAGQGMKSGVMSMGQASQMVAGGAFTEQELAMYGGKSGVSQSLTEMNAATIQTTMKPLLPYLVDEDSKGRLTLNKERMANLQAGKITYEDALKQGASKQFSDRGMQNLSGNQSKALVNDLSNQMGAEGTQRLQLETIMSFQKSNPGISANSFATSMYGEDNAAILMRLADPTVQRNITQKREEEIQRLQFEAAGKQRSGPSFLARHGMDFEFNAMEKGYDKISGFIANKEESEMLTAVGVKRFNRGGYQGAGFAKGSDFFAAEERFGDSMSGPGFKARNVDRNPLFRDDDEAFMSTYASGASKYVGEGQSREANSRIRGERKRGAAAAGKVMSAYAMGGGADIVEAGEAASKERGTSSEDLLEKKHAIARLMKKHDGLLSTTQIGHAEMESALGKDWLAGASASEISAVMEGGRIRAGKSGDTYMNKWQGEAQKGLVAGVGRDFLDTGVQNGAQDAIKSALGLDLTLSGSGSVMIDGKDVNRTADVDVNGTGATQTILDAITADSDPTETFYLFWIALMDSSSGEDALKIEKKLQKKFGDQHGVYEKKARARYAKLSKKEREALVNKAPQMTKSSSLLGPDADFDEALGKVTKGLSAAKDAIQISASNNVMKGFEAKMNGAGAQGGISKTSPTAAKDYLQSLQKLGGSDLDALKAVVSEEDVDTLMGLDLTSEEGLNAGYEIIKKNSGEGGTTDISEHAGRTSDEVDAAKANARSEKEVFARFSASVDNNVSALQENTRALRGNAANAAASIVEWLKE
jgi:hypothetical protein